MRQGKKERELSMEKGGQGRERTLHGGGRVGG